MLESSTIEVFLAAANSLSMISRIAIVALLLITAWIVMVVTHELGHLLGGWCGGATLVACDLAPWRLPYSFHDPDPHPQLTLWAGPVFGVVAPILVAALVRRRWMWLIADFCLLANGVYLATGWFADDRWLDTPQMLDAAVHPVWIAIFCLLTIVPGYFRLRADLLRLLAPAPTIAIR